jgi:hypothetical protein
VVNAIIDACYRSAKSKQWEAVLLEEWRGEQESTHVLAQTDYDEQYSLIKQERMPDGQLKLILRDKSTGEIVQRVK